MQFASNNQAPDWTNMNMSMGGNSTVDDANDPFAAYAGGGGGFASIK